MASRQLSARADAPPLVEAKLALPRQRAGAIERPRLRHLLEAATDAELTLVAAPVGYGKTTAVAAWCARRDGPTAWVTLDPSDDDPVRLWRSVATAVDRVRQGLGRSALRHLGTPGGSVEVAVNELMNGISAYEDQLVVVLDDLNLVSSPEALATVRHALDCLPANGRLIGITRADPQLELATMRARGALAEVRASDLAFTTEEAYELLVERGELDLESGEVKMLCERTEGWPAALFLALLWLQRVDDPRAAVREFGADHRFVAEYLSREVLAGLDDDLRSFLLRASVLGQFTAELSDDVLGRSDSASVLAELERSNLFVFPLDHGGWFRIHPLFAEFARLQLVAAEPDAATAIHRGAARWLAARGLVVDAAEHAAAAHDDDLVARVLLESHLVLIRSGESRTVLRVARSLGEAQLTRHPELAAAAATAAGIVGEAAVERRRFLALVSRAVRERPEAVSSYARATAAMVRAATVDHDVSRAVREGREAVRIAEADADDVLLAALGALARALYFAGDLDEAWTIGLRAIEHPDAQRRVPGLVFARSTLALVAASQGRLRSARHHGDAARSLSFDNGRSWLGANASAALGVVLMGEGDLAGAERELGHSASFFRDELASVHHAWLLVLLARVSCRRGRLERAQAALRSAREELEEIEDSGRVAGLAAEVAHELEEARRRALGGELLNPPSVAELAVLRLLDSDLTTREIATTLFVSPNTVRSHTRALYRKLGVSSRADAVARATELDLLGDVESPG